MPRGIYTRTKPAWNKGLRTSPWDTPTYRCWAAMRRRCENPQDADYPHYGGRGITVCDRWRSSFHDFCTDMGERPDGLSLDRINNDGNYEPSNCRWATWSQQMANRRGWAAPKV